MTLKPHNDRMKAAQKRATVYFDASLHRALRIKAAVTERSVSEIVNTVVRQGLAEDAEDLAAFEERANEPNLAFEAVLKDLRRRGKL
jgi:plasmid stability protein